MTDERKPLPHWLCGSGSEQHYSQEDDTPGGTRTASIELPAPVPDADAIRQELFARFTLNDGYEVRGIGRGGTSQYFASPWFYKAVEAAMRMAHDGLTVCATLNPLDPDEMDFDSVNAARDSDIAWRRWLLVDIDPERPKRVSSTQEELDAALALAEVIMAYLRARGWSEPRRVMSGNGVHLFYPLDLPNTSEVTAAVKAALRHLAGRFDTDAVKVDTSVYNASRVVKLAGTVACKGRHTAERPHRLSVALTPDYVRGAPVTLDQLRALEPPPPPRPRKAAPPGAVGGGCTDDDWSRVKQILRSDSGIPADDREDWIEVGMALHSTGRPDAREIWIEWSQTTKRGNFDPAECEKAWRSFKDKADHGITLATLFHLAKEHGCFVPPRVSVEAGIFPDLKNGSAPEWPDEPEPLDSATASAPYPLDALPGMVGEAVREYLAYGQQPAAMVASSALAAVALAVQGLADVARDSQLTGPLSLNFLIVAQSGERKSAADKVFTSPLAQWERGRRDALAEPLARNKAERAAWLAVREGIQAAIKQAAKSGRGDPAGLRTKLSDHATTEPAELVLPRLRYEDCNPESLAHALTKGHPSAALWSDEAGLVVGSHGMGKDSILRFMSFLNRLWDGRDFHQDRKTVESTSVEGRRFSCCLMMQSDVLRGMQDGSKGLSRGSGFLARYLICEPASTIGARPYREPDATPRLDAFGQRIGALLDRPLPLDAEGRLHPPALTMTAEAKAVWKDYFNRTENRLGAYGDLDTVRDFASKSAENAARIAGCFHIFEGIPGHAIDAPTMTRAVRLAGWYLEETLRLLNVLDEPQVVRDARLMDEWLADNAPGGSVSANDVLQHGPNRLRAKARRDAALAVLIDKGRVRLVKVGRQGMIVRHPHLVHAENHSLPTATAIPAIVATDE